MSIENSLTTYTVSQAPKKRQVLILAPHPDDEVFGCGGVILKHVAAGAHVHVILLTSGEKGGDADTRLAESREASRILGYESLITWHLPDRGVEYSIDLIDRIEKTIDELMIELLYAPSLWENHPDHRATALSAIEVVRRKQHLCLMLYEISAPLRPNKLIDISVESQIKALAMNCFNSQQSNQNYCEQITALNKYRTYTLPKEVTSAEAFEYYTSADVQTNNIAFFQRESDRQINACLLNVNIEKPLISILIRRMNFDSLQTALDSVSIQTYQHIEIIIINASGKSHRQLDRTINRIPIHFIDSETPLTRPQAANVALENAHGEYALFLDDDDWIGCTHIEKLYNAIANNSAILAHTDAIQINEHGKTISTFNGKDVDSREIYIRNYMPIHSVLFRMAAYRNHNCRFDETLPLLEDWDFWISLKEHEEFKYIPGISAFYFSPFGSRSGATKEHALKGPISLIYKKWINHWCEEHGFYIHTMAFSKANNIKLVHSRNQLAKELDSLRSQLAKELDSLRNKYNACYQELERAKLGMRAILTSRSWRFTLPMRALMRKTKNSLYLVRKLIKQNP